MLLWCGMTLGEYLERNKITRAAFARAIGVSHTAVSSWVYRGRVPRKALVAAISAETFGAVRPEDFYPHAVEDAAE